MGIIESVDMIDFMCHKYLTFNFGPQVNFIIGESFLLLLYRRLRVSGHNGSKLTHCPSSMNFKWIQPQIGGKSAVLSAITVALGGKATTTGRGSGLKSFVREGQQ